MQHPFFPLVSYHNTLQKSEQLRSYGHFPHPLSLYALNKQLDGPNFPFFIMMLFYFKHLQVIRLENIVKRIYYLGSHRHPLVQYGQIIAKYLGILPVSVTNSHQNQHYLRKRQVRLRLVFGTSIVQQTQKLPVCGYK
jgi:hypothetical protein